MGRAFLIWSVVAATICIAVLAAAASPLLAWRDPVYIAAGFAGVVSMGLLLIQPMLVAGLLPGLAGIRGRRIHRATGVILVLCVMLHVGGLWITSPPDVIDALTFNSPTPFSAWGVVSMWALFAGAVLALFHKRLRLRPRIWRLGHKSLALLVVIGGVVHAMQIDGTMEIYSKTVLCLLALVATITALTGYRPPNK